MPTTWLNYRKPFGSISHHWIKKSHRIYKIYFQNNYFISTHSDVPHHQIGYVESTRETVSHITSGFTELTKTSTYLHWKICMSTQSKLLIVISEKPIISPSSGTHPSILTRTGKKRDAMLLGTIIPSERNIVKKKKTHY